MKLNGAYINIPVDWIAAFGINQAIFMKRLYDWLSWAEKKGTAYKQDDGKLWIYNSYAQWQEQLPWFSTRTLRRIVEKCQGYGVLLTAPLNAHSGDQTLWYTLDEEAIEAHVDKVATCMWTEWPSHDVAKMADSTYSKKNNTINKRSVPEELLPYLEE